MKKMYFINKNTSFFVVFSSFIIPKSIFLNYTYTYFKHYILLYYSWGKTFDLTNMLQTEITHLIENYLFLYGKKREMSYIQTYNNYS